MQELLSHRLQSYYKQSTLSTSWWRSRESSKDTERTTQKLLHGSTATSLPWCVLSPAELLMWRHLRIDVPQLTKQFILNRSYLDNFHTAEKKLKGSQKHNYDKIYCVCELPTLPNGLPLWVDSEVPGEITQRAAPRSYYVDTHESKLLYLWVRQTQKHRFNPRNLLPAPAW